MVVTLERWGNSQGIRIPKMLLDSLQWNENERLALSSVNGEIIIKKAKMPRKSIEELFDGYSGEYQPTDVDWGKPEGKELW